MTHLLFAGHYYYPKGGVDDLVARGSVDELKRLFEERAEEIANGSYIRNWGQIVNAETLECELYGRLDDEAAQAEWSTGRDPDE